MVFPIIFLYRQYLDLRLKQIIRDGFRLLDDDREFPKKHELDKLWQICKSILEKIEPKASHNDIEAVDEAIGQFCTLDPSSEAFRYPIKKSGERSLPADLQYINLRNLADVMGKLTNFFDTAEEIVCVCLGYKSEMDNQW